MEQTIETLFILKMESRYQSDWKDIYCWNIESMEQMLMKYCFLTWTQNRVRLQGFCYEGRDSIVLAACLFCCIFYQTKWVLKYIVKRIKIQRLARLLCHKFITKEARMKIYYHTCILFWIFSLLSIQIPWKLLLCVYFFHTCNNSW